MARKINKLVISQIELVNFVKNDEYLSVDCHSENFISRLMLESDAFRCSLETVWNARQNSGFDDLKIKNKKIQYFDWFSFQLKFTFQF